LHAEPSGVGGTLFLVIVVPGNLVGAATFVHLGGLGLDVRAFSGAKACCTKVGTGFELLEHAKSII